MFKTSSSSDSAGQRTERTSAALHSSKYRHSSGERGSAIIELAVILPLFLLLVTGITTFGIALNQYLQLVNAVSIGAQSLSVERANTTNPCQDTSQIIYKAAPFLHPNDMTLTYVLDGTTYGPYKGAAANTCSSSTITSGAAGNLRRGHPAKVIATYPCTIAVYGANIIPGCELRSEVTEMVQ